MRHFGGAAIALGAEDLWPALAAAAGTAEQRPDLSPDLPAGTRAEAILEALPGKKPLVKLTYRPPNYETPVSYLDSLFTPNDAFFVRYHLADIPEVEERSWKLRVGGEGRAVKAPGRPASAASATPCTKTRNAKVFACGLSYFLQKDRLARRADARRPARSLGNDLADRDRHASEVRPVSDAVLAPAIPT